MVGVHELRLFAVSTSIKVASVHVVLARRRSQSRSDCAEVQAATTKILRDRYGYDMVTVQTERELRGSDSAGCVQCRPIGEGAREAMS